MRRTKTSLITMLIIVAMLLLPTIIRADAEEPSSSLDSLRIGLNYLSAGNRGDDHRTSRLNSDFQFFVANNITYIDVRLVWSSLETAMGVYNDARLANYERLLNVAHDHGLRVGITFWTQPPYESRNFALPSWVPSWNALFTNAIYRNAWLAWVEHTRDILSSYPALAYWQICNEPYIGRSQRSDLETFISLTADKLIPTGIPVSCRFIAGWNPYLGYFGSTSKLMDKLDFLSLTVYNDPDSDGYNTPSRCYWTDIESSIEDAHADGKEAWIIEFGLNYDRYGAERQRQHYEKSLRNRFIPYHADAVFAWAWVSAGPLDYNIANGVADARPAFYELPLAIQSFPPPSPPPPSPPAPTQYTLTVQSTSGGTTSPTGTNTYNGGTVVSVTAQPNAQYEFSHWIIDQTIETQENPVSITMNQDHALNAYFAEIPLPPPPQEPEPPTTYTLKIQALEGGTTSPTGIVEISEGDAISVTADASSGWEFSHWQFDGENVGDTNPVTVQPQDANAMHTLVAVFAELPSTDVMHVERIYLTRYGTRYVRCRAVVTILDSTGSPVSGATVEVIWSGLTSREQSGVTGTDGKVTFYSYRIRRWSRGRVTFAVDDVIKTGWIYDPSANRETIDRIVF